MNTNVMNQKKIIMKNQNSKKITPFTFLAIAIGISLAFTDDYIIEYFSNRPTLGVLFVAILLFGLITLSRSYKIKESKS